MNEAYLKIARNVRKMAASGLGYKCELKDRKSCGNNREKKAVEKSE